MTELTARPAGCAICNPALEKPLDEIIEERRKEIAEVLHVVRTGDGYHILQIPGADGAPCTSWQGPFESESAASLYRDDLIYAAAEGNPGNACCSGGIYDHFNLAGRILDLIEAHDGDARSLASEIASKEPWKHRTATVADASEIPF